MTRRTCTAPRPITQALPDRVVHARPGQTVEFTADEAEHLDPTYWSKPKKSTTKSKPKAVEATEKEA